MKINKISELSAYRNTDEALAEWHKRRQADATSYHRAIERPIIHEPIVTRSAFRSFLIGFWLIGAVVLIAIVTK